ncbi:MAG: GIDE domain-containing protein [Gammaproteobacteria bacterium]
MDIASSIAGAEPQNFWIAVVFGFLAASACFYLTFRFLQRSRLIADTPTAKIRSAAQGYTELEGKAELMPGAAVIAPLTGEPCPWYSYKIEKRRTGSGSGHHKNHWVTLERGVSDAIFLLRDDTGVCIVDPDGAEVTPSVTLTWYGHERRPAAAPETSSFYRSIFHSGDYRYSEKRIRPADDLYAIGDFISSGGDHNLQSAGADVRDLLNSWKKNRPVLLNRFDTDKNGEIDLGEWEDARRQAERETAETRRRQAAEPQYHVLRKPKNGRGPYILSTVDQRKMIIDFRLYAGLSALGFIGLGAFLVWTLALRLS